MPGACPEAWQQYGCQSLIPYLLGWTYFWERLDLTVLALMLAYAVLIVARASFRIRSVRCATDFASDESRNARTKLVAELTIRSGGLKAIAFAAPYFGLAGTCIGISDGLSVGYSGTVGGFLAMLSSDLAAALLPCAAGLLVAIAAVASYNFLRTRIDLLKAKIYHETLNRRRRHFQIAQTLPLRPRFSTLPYAVIAASALAISISAFMTLSSVACRESAYCSPRGLPVHLAKIGTSETGHSSVDPITIEIVGTGSYNPPLIYVNSKETSFDKLANQVRIELESHPQRQIHVKAQNDIFWSHVTYVIDVAEGLHANVVLLTIPPDIGVARKSTR